MCLINQLSTRTSIIDGTSNICLVLELCSANIILPSGAEPLMMKVVDNIKTSKNNNNDSEKTKPVLHVEFPIILHPFGILRTLWNIGNA